MRDSTGIQRTFRLAEPGTVLGQEHVAEGMNSLWPIEMRTTNLHQYYNKLEALITGLWLCTDTHQSEILKNVVRVMVLGGLQGLSYVISHIFSNPQCVNLDFFSQPICHPPIYRSPARWQSLLQKPIHPLGHY